MNLATLFLLVLFAGGTTALFWVLLKRGAESTVRQYRLLGQRFGLAVDLRTGDPERVKRVLDPAMRGRMAELLAGGKASIHVDSGLLAFTEFGLIANDAARERFEKVAILLDELAEKLESDP